MIKRQVVFNSLKRKLAISCVQNNKTITKVSSKNDKKSFSFDKNTE